ncbi:MAG: hypothetical protein JRJ11_07180, partial [Deltaproteobacteria bacterium]|nr:hypothetical protein [Deltaproteobacteria bacterium]
MRQSAVRIWDTLKGLNTKEGFDQADDRPPEIWFRPIKGTDGQPLILRDYFGKKELNRQDIVRLVQDYYDERGWSKAPSNARK